MLNPDEAELVSFWCQFLAGAMPPLVRRRASLGPEAGALLARGLSRVTVRYLLAQGGGCPDVSLVGDQRDSQRALWSRPFVALDFRRPLLAWLAHAATGAPDAGEAAEPVGAGGETVLLMIADELALRPRADLPLATVTRRGALAWLAHGGRDTPAFPDDPAFDDLVFFARGRLALAWCMRDPVGGSAGPANGLESLLERVDERAAAWRILRARVLAGKRYDALALLCTAAAVLWQRLAADQLLARVEEAGRFTGESARQAVYRRLLDAYAWLADLEAWAAEARRTSQYDDDFARWQVYLAHYRRIPESARRQGSRLLARLRRTL
jgi:hypothetical protein